MKGVPRGEAIPELRRCLAALLAIVSTAFLFAVLVG